VNDEGSIAHANPVAQAWLSQALSPEEADRLREAIQDLVQRADETPEMVLGFTGLDLELSAAPVIAEGTEEPSAAVVAIHDVTQLKSLDRMKTHFVTNISHELRTPITTIKLYAHLLQRTPLEDKKWTDYLDALVQEADHQAQLGEDILQISRIYDGLLQTAPRPTSLDELVEAAVIRQQAMARKRCVTVEHHVVQPSPVALVDPRQIVQVLQILVGEAIHFTAPNGQVVISSGQKEAEGRLWATVSVSDTGEVIPAEDLPHIFERFFREEEPRSVRVSATGLRLMIVKGIVELNGGQVIVESPATSSGGAHVGDLAPSEAEHAEQPRTDRQDAGVTFTIYLPLAD
jgi:two-component system phosphate regulon sensor histidine kinase PhoR